MELIKSRIKTHMIILFPFESRQRTVFSCFLIQHIPLVNNPITKRILSNVQCYTFLLISTNNLSSLTEIS